MSSVQLAHDATNRVVVEWNKNHPIYRVIIDSIYVRGYQSEKAAMRAAKRQCKLLNLTLEKNRYADLETGCPRCGLHHGHRYPCTEGDKL